MKKLYFIISLFLITLLNLLPAQAQKVGLVLSGGGAEVSPMARVSTWNSTF